MLAKITAMLKDRGYELYTKPNQLNIIGLRSKDEDYEDEFHIFYKKQDGKWNYHLYMGTCGKELEGQYKDAYMVGKLNDSKTIIHKYMEKGTFGEFKDLKATEEIVKLCEQHENLYGNSLTFTLIDFRDSVKSKIHKIANTVSMIAKMVVEFTK